MATQPTERDRDMERLEKMFNRGMVLIGFLATLGIGSGFFTYWSFSEKIEGIAEKAEAKLNSVSAQTEKDLQEAVATAKDELVDDLRGKINVEEIADQAKSESVTLITEALRNEFDSNISETQIKMSDLLTKTEQAQSQLAQLDNNYAKLIKISEEVTDYDLNIADLQVNSTSSFVDVEVGNDILISFDLQSKTDDERYFASTPSSIEKDVRLSVDVVAVLMGSTVKTVQELVIGQPRPIEIIMTVPDKFGENGRTFPPGEYNLEVYAKRPEMDVNLAYSRREIKVSPGK